VDFEAKRAARGKNYERAHRATEREEREACLSQFKVDLLAILII
jgi:hypothetical protein